MLANPEGAEAVLETPEGARAVIGTLEKAEAVVRTPEGAGAVAVVEPLEEAGAELQGASGEQLRLGEERAGGRGNPKRKRSDDSSLPPKRVKKCRAVHGLDQKELWCKPCINSKKCVKYIYLCIMKY